MVLGLGLVVGIIFIAGLLGVFWLGLRCRC
jgi:hypothetical protein